jgi:hypothetical protein
MTTIERFRLVAQRSLDAIKHCDLRPYEQEADHRLRNTLLAEWTVPDMNTVISADHRINRPFIPEPLKKY